MASSSDINDCLWYFTLLKIKFFCSLRLISGSYFSVMWEIIFGPTIFSLFWAPHIRSPRGKWTMWANTIHFMFSFLIVLWLFRIDCKINSMQVPHTTFLLTHVCFLFYHVSSNMTLRRIQHSIAHLPEKTQFLFKAAWILALSYFIAYLETVAISNVSELHELQMYIHFSLARNVDVVLVCVSIGVWGWGIIPPLKQFFFKHWFRFSLNC